MITRRTFLKKLLLAIAAVTVTPKPFIPKVDIYPPPVPLEWLNSADGVLKELLEGAVIKIYSGVRPTNSLANNDGNLLCTIPVGFEKEETRLVGEGLEVGKAVKDGDASYFEMIPTSNRFKYSGNCRGFDAELNLATTVICKKSDINIDKINLSFPEEYDI